MTTIAETILAMVERVEADERHIGVLSTGEALSVALVLDRKDLLDVRNGGYTMLEAVERVGADWRFGLRQMVASAARAVTAVLMRIRAVRIGVRSPHATRRSPS